MWTRGKSPYAVFLRAGIWRAALVCFGTHRSSLPKPALPPRTCARTKWWFATPVITGGEFAHKGSFDNLLGADADAARRAEVSLEQHVTQDTPPAFLWHTYTDPGVPVENTMLFAMALRRAGVPFESHIYSVGGHGLSLANELTENTAGAGVQAECTGWVDLAAGWLRR